MTVCIVDKLVFPVGKVEKEDNDLEETARRETEEEVGVNRETLQLFGTSYQRSIFLQAGFW